MVVVVNFRELQAWYRVVDERTRNYMQALDLLVAHRRLLRAERKQLADDYRELEKKAEQIEKKAQRCLVELRSSSVLGYNWVERALGAKIESVSSASAADKPQKLKSQSPKKPDSRGRRPGRPVPQKARS